MTILCRLIKHALLALLLSASLTPARSETRVVVIYSDSSHQTMRTLSGLDWSLRNATDRARVTMHYLTNTGEDQVNKVRGYKGNLFVTVGTIATAFAREHFSSTPVIFAKVLNPIESGFISSWENPAPNITGAALDIPADQQVQRFKHIVPGLRRMGMIYTNRTQRLAEEARAACRAQNIEFLGFLIESNKELPAAIDSLVRTVDGLWAIADEELAAPQFVRFMLIESLKYKVPIMGFNQTIVQNGALFCLEADYKFNGRQAGDMVLDYLNGKPISAIKPAVPDIVYLYLNLKSGKLLNIDIAAELISVAKETF